MAIGYRSVLQSQGGQGNNDCCVTVDGSPYGTANGLFAASYLSPLDGNNLFTGEEKELIVGNNIYDCTRMLYGSRNFNGNVTFGENVLFCNSVLEYCENYNKPFILPNSVKDASSALAECKKFNSTVDFGESCYDLSYIFVNCYNLNRDIRFKNANSISYAFSLCRNFNSIVTIDTKTYTSGTSPEKCAFTAQGLFSSCANYNRNTDFNIAIRNLSYVFYDCQKFNSRVNIYKTENVVNMFSNATIFNKEVAFPHSNIDGSSLGLNMAFTFRNATNFNCTVRVPNRANNIISMLENATSFGNTVYVNNKNFSMSQVRNLFKGCNNSKRKTIYCNNGRNLIGNTASNSLVGAAVTWSAITNGYYNATYNVYIYYNYTGSG